MNYRETTNAIEKALWGVHPDLMLDMSVGQIQWMGKGDVEGIRISPKAMKKFPAHGLDKRLVGLPFYIRKVGRKWLVERADLSTVCRTRREALQTVRETIIERDLHRLERSDKYDYDGPSPLVCRFY